ncbi:MAG: lysophospholipid acyltransferase family protein [Sphingobium sp.]
MMIAIRSFLFAAAFYLLSVLWVLAAALVAPLSERTFRSVISGWGWMHRTLCRVLLGQRVKVEGILPDEPMLFVFKHESMFETIDLLCLFDRPVAIAKQELIDIPGWGWLAKRYGMIGLRRADGARALRQLRREAQAAIAADRPLCLFPEGTRVPHGDMPPIKAGFAGLYQLLGLPVIPVAVDSGRLSPRNSLLKRPGIVTYLVGEIIPPGLPRAEAEARAHAAINALNRRDDHRAEGV